MRPTPQFTAELAFHFRGHGPERRHWFMFDESLHRRTPMQMEAVEGLHTIGMWVEHPQTFRAGESVKVSCAVIAPQLFESAVKPGVTFELWDGGFFARGVILERIDAGWPT